MAKSFAQTLYDLGPFLRHAGVALLKRGDFGTNLQQGLLLGAQEAGEQRKRDQAERVRQANRKIAEALFGGPRQALLQSTVPQQPGIAGSLQQPTMQLPGRQPLSMIPPLQQPGMLAPMGAPGLAPTSQPAPTGPGQVPPGMNPYDALPQDLRDAYRTAVETYGPQVLSSLGGIGAKGNKPQLTERSDGTKVWVWPDGRHRPAIPGEKPDPKKLTADFTTVKGADGEIYAFNKRTGEIRLATEGEKKAQEPATLTERNQGELMNEAFLARNTMVDLMRKAGFDPTNIRNWLLQKVEFGSLLNTEDNLAFNQAAKAVMDVITVTRTGAGQTPGELKFRQETFLPQPGDSNELIYQKVTTMDNFLKAGVAALITRTKKNETENLTNMEARKLLRQLNEATIGIGGKGRFLDIAGLRESDFAGITPPIPQGTLPTRKQIRDRSRRKRKLDKQGQLGTSPLDDLLEGP